MTVLSQGDGGPDDMAADGLLQRSVEEDVVSQEIGVGGADASSVLGLVSELGFNPRSSAAWDALAMDAVTCHSDGELVGAIPFERRSWQVRPGVVADVVHETVVGLRPELRGGGIGSAMQDALFASPPTGVEAATVFREKPESGAYRWYRSTGFEPVWRIDSWLGAPQGFAAVPEMEIAPFDPAQPDGHALEALDRFRTMVFAAGSGGHIDRSCRPLGAWLAAHPYVGRYRFWLAWLGPIESPSATAVCGVGRLHSESDRLEILELCAADWDVECAEVLVRGLIGEAARQGWEPIRWAIAESDPLASIAEDVGLVSQWSFEMLVRPIRASVSVSSLRAAAQETPWRFQALDYI